MQSKLNESFLEIQVVDPGENMRTFPFWKNKSFKNTMYSYCYNRITVSRLHRLSTTLYFTPVRDGYFAGLLQCLGLG